MSAFIAALIAAILAAISPDAQIPTTTTTIPQVTTTTTTTIPADVQIPAPVECPSAGRRDTIPADCLVRHPAPVE